MLEFKFKTEKSRFDHGVDPCKCRFLLRNWNQPRDRCLEKIFQFKSAKSKKVRAKENEKIGFRNFNRYSR